jgi:hypothetical protein
VQYGRMKSPEELEQIAARFTIEGIGNNNAGED